MRRMLRASVWLLLIGMAVALPTPADARRGSAVFSHGAVISHVGEPTDEQAQVVRAEIGTDASVGFVHDAFGVFWLDLWTWNGRYCLFEDDRYWELSAERAAALLGRSPGELREPLFYTFPPGLLALLGVAAGVVPYAFYSRYRDEKIQRVSMSPYDVE